LINEFKLAQLSLETNLLFGLSHEVVHRVGLLLRRTHFVKAILVDVLCGPDLLVQSVKKILVKADGVEYVLILFVFRQVARE
jgi:hypothetical protein